MFISFIGSVHGNDGSWLTIVCHRALIKVYPDPFRCLWYPQFDRFASYSYYNESLFAVGTVYGVYYEWGGEVLTIRSHLELVRVLLLRVNVGYLTKSDLNQFSWAWFNQTFSINQLYKSIVDQAKKWSLWKRWCKAQLAAHATGV